MDDKNNLTERVIESRLSSTKSITSAVTAIIICIGLFIWLSTLNLRLVESVKKGSPNAYPGITYEEAFGKFYSNPKWEDASTGQTKIVRFTGNCSYNGKSAKVVLDFWVNNDVFGVLDGSINGVTAGIFELNEMNNQPFETYKK